MPEITVCIPAFSAHEFIAHTLSSVQRQSFADFRVIIALERTEDHASTLARVESFLGDPRFSVTVNDGVLGWAENVAALLRRVETEFFVVLPHDDLWSEDYLGELYAALQQAPDAAAAYADIETFGAKQSLTQVQLDNESTFSRLFSFYVSGASAVHWRGLTCSKVLERAEFPTNEFASYAVECVWSSYLLTKGRVLRVPGPRYLKRAYPRNSRNVAGQWRAATSDEWVLKALKAHRKQMLHVLKKAPIDERERRAAAAACDAACLKRSVEMLADRPRLMKLYLEPLEQALEAAALLDSPLKEAVGSVVEYARARALKVLGRHQEAEAAAERSVEANPRNWEAHVMLSLLLSKKGQGARAVECADRALRLAPGSSEAYAALNISRVVCR